MTLRRRAIVSGVVQGVGFRVATVERANELGVRGSVRNLPDGRVEAIVEGDDAAVERMLAWLGRGPFGSRVDGVEVSEVSEVDPADELSNAEFRIRRD